MCAAIGHPVRKLTRTKMGPISLGDLKLGHWRDLTPAEVQKLQRAARQHEVHEVHEGHEVHEATL